MTEVDERRQLKRAAMRRATLQLVVGSVAFHALAFAVYYGADVGHKPPKLQQYFVIVWTISTALLVATMLKRVRKARFRY